MQSPGMKTRDRAAQVIVRVRLGGCKPQNRTHPIALSGRRPVPSFDSRGIARHARALSKWLLTFKHSARRGMKIWTPPNGTGFQRSSGMMLPLTA